MNGRALLSGVRLKKLEASEMVDVIHAMYEDDNTVTNEVEYRVKHAVRKNLYSVAYDREYRFGDVDSTSEYADADGVQVTASKPYIPPTQVNADSARPYGAALDSPVG